MTAASMRTPIRDLARLVLNPSYRDVHKSVWRAFTIDAMMNLDPTGVTPEQICEHLKKTFGMDGLSPLVPSDALELLKDRGEAVFRNGLWTLTPAARGEIVRQSREATKAHQDMLESFVTKVGEVTGYRLDDHQAAFIRRVFEDTLLEYLDGISGMTLSYLNLGAHGEQVLLLKDVLMRKAAETQIEIEHREEIASALGQAVDAIFAEPPTQFSRGLLQAAMKHVLWRVSAVDPALKKYQAALFTDAPILIDTNLLIAAVCKGSERHKHTRWLLEAIRSVGIPIYVSDATLAEYHQAVDFIDYLYNDVHGKSLTSRILWNDFAKTYIKYDRKHLDWSSYISKMSSADEIFLREWKTTVVKIGDLGLNPDQVTVTKGILRGMASYEAADRPDALLTHDAESILAVQALRRQKPDRPFNSPWFVTHHRNLRRGDEAVRKHFRLPLNSTISAAALFELIYPFLWTTMDATQAAEVFAKMVAGSVLPTPTPTAKSFVEYLASEASLGTEDEDIILKIVEQSHRRRILEKDLDKGDMKVALGTFVQILDEGIQSKKQLTQKDTTIRRLRERIQSTTLPREWQVEVELVEWKERLAAVKAAKTNDEKKNTLEDFAVFFVRCLPGLKVVGKNVRTAAEEIDVMVKNASRLPWGDPILVECKNWSKPVGKNEVVLFQDKLEKQRSSTGILIARNGITGSEYRDAMLRLREALWEEGVRILLLTLDDLDKIECDDDLLKLLEARYYSPEGSLDKNDEQSS